MSSKLLVIFFAKVNYQVLNLTGYQIGKKVSIYLRNSLSGEL